MRGNKIYKGIPTKDGRCYYFRKSKNNRQYTSKKYMTKEECEKALSIFILKNDNPINIRFDTIGNEYFEDLKEKKKLSTYYSYYTSYSKNILPFFKTKYINKITIQEINIWKNEMIKNGFQINHLNNLYSLLNSIFKFAGKTHSINNNPVPVAGRFEICNDKVIADKDKTRYITLNDFNIFINVIDDMLWKTFFVTAFYSGMRKGEMQALTWADIDLTKKEIKVNKTLGGKTNDTFKITNTKNTHNRIIKMSNTLYINLLNYKNSQIKYTDFSENWFVFGGPTHLPSTTIDRYKHKYFELSGIKEITMHEFRHSHVSLLINEYLKSGQTDTSKFFVMMSNRLGHTIDVMQKTYMHLFPTIQDEIVDLLNNI